MGFINWSTRTRGGRVWWYTLERRNGWKLQQHKLTDHYRILDPDDYRQAWDTDYATIKHEFDKFTGATNYNR